MIISLVVGSDFILSYLGNGYAWKDSNQNPIWCQGPKSKILNFKEQNQHGLNLEDTICNLVLKNTK